MLAPPSQGELFGGLDVLADGSDAHTLLQRLARCSSHAAAGPSGDALNVSKTSGASDEDSVPAVLAALRGPWALVYWQQAAQRLWVARDPTGRRSLLVRAAACVWHPLALASVAPEAAGPGAAGAAVTAAAADAAALSLAVAGLERAAAATITAAGAEVGVDSAATPAAEAAAARHDQLWVELEPGIYSADAEALVSLPAAPPAPATELSSSSSDCAAAARSMLRRHAWPGQCAQQHLRRFQRPARLIHDGGELQPGGPPIAASLICSAGHSAAVASALEVAAAGMLQALETAVRVRCDSIGR